MDKDNDPASSELAGSHDAGTDGHSDPTSEPAPPQQRRRVILRGLVTKGVIVPFWTYRHAHKLTAAQRALEPRQRVLFSLLGKLCGKNRDFVRATQPLLLRRMGFEREKTLREDLRILERAELIALDKDEHGRRGYVIEGGFDHDGTSMFPSDWFGGRIPWGVLGNSELSFGAKLAFAVLEFHGNDKGRIVPEHATLATELGCSVSAAQRHLNELRDFGLLEIESGKSRYTHNTYHFLDHRILNIDSPWRVSDALDLHGATAAERATIRRVHGDPFIAELQSGAVKMPGTYAADLLYIAAQEGWIARTEPGAFDRLHLV